MKQFQKTEMFSVLDSLIKSNVFAKKEVFIFGHCTATEEMLKYLLESKITPAAILDNNKAKQNSEFHNIKILPPEIIKNYCAGNSIVLIANRFYSQMSAQCRSLGYDGEIVQVMDYNSFSEYSLSDDTIKLKIERLERGMITLDHMRKHYPTEHFVVCPYCALGDVYMAMSFLQSYCEKNNIQDVVIILIGNACKQVAEMFGSKKITLLEKSQMDEFVQAIIYTNEQNSIIAHHDCPYTDNSIKWLNKHFLSFVNFYKYSVYGLSEIAEQSKPTSYHKYDNSDNIPKGKSVILAPYSKSIVCASDEFWIKTAQNYSNNGFNVYTNVVGNEKEIKGTKPLRIPISQILSAVEHAGIFIGMRSGLCDVIDTANCKKVVVFPDSFYSTTPWKVADFFDLPNFEKTII